MMQQSLSQFAATLSQLIIAQPYPVGSDHTTISLARMQAVQAISMILQTPTPSPLERAYRIMAILAAKDVLLPQNATILSRIPQQFAKDTDSTTANPAQGERPRGKN